MIKWGMMDVYVQVGGQSDGHTVGVARRQLQGGEWEEMLFLRGHTRGTSTHRVVVLSPLPSATATAHRCGVLQ